MCSGSVKQRGKKLIIAVFENDEHHGMDFANDFGTDAGALVTAVSTGEDVGEEIGGDDDEDDDSSSEDDDLFWRSPTNTKMVKSKTTEAETLWCLTSIPPTTREPPTVKLYFVLTEQSKTIGQAR